MQTAISLNLYRKSETTASADIEVRNRIWWTIYCHDRSLSAGLGRPLGVPDSVITAEVSDRYCASNIETVLINSCRRPSRQPRRSRLLCSTPSLANENFWAGCGLVSPPPATVTTSHASPHLVKPKSMDGGPRSREPILSLARPQISSRRNSCAFSSDQRSWISIFKVI